jgi:molecular chaperone GrpE
MVKKTKIANSGAEEIVKLTARIEELENNYRRALADYQNQERRHQVMSSSLVKMASATLVEKLLLNLDALQLAQSHLNDKGLQMVIDQFNSTLSQEGLQKIETDHQVFDPITMDCTEVIPGEKDIVVETVSPGYFLFDKVLRPAKVKVGNGIESNSNSK